ncbi:MAG: hypothetical protein ACODAA_03205 [Gemmatimonadota bacterium]
MTPRRARTTSLVAAFLAAFLAAGCGDDQAGERAGPPGAGEAPDTAAPSVDPTAGGPAAADTATATPSGDPFHGFDLPSDGAVRRESRVARLLLRNTSDEPAVVYGDGGAGEVLLDTVPPDGERRVDVTTRAVRLGLRSESTAGEALRRDEVSVGLDSLLEVSVGRTASAPRL